ncbi:MAG: hypothetical protein QGH52_00385 [Prochlorococcaceae cyanobacterium ETNP1_MAG_8]|nr:hypothetical protein [Prochlorococcaceae cyanobacterium ETNP1_MAG_8]
MIEASNSRLRVEPLKASHLPLLNASENTGRVLWLESMLWRGWLANAEQYLPSLLPARQPSCLVAFEQKKPVGFIVFRPYNRRGTCWSVSLPELLNEPQYFSTRCVRHDLLKIAIQNGSKRAQGWILRCPANDTDQLAITRELGFQPLKLFQGWNPPSQGTELTPNWPIDLSWHKLNRRTAALLWPLENAGGSSHLRQIVDRRWNDLLDQNQTGSGVLLTKGGATITAIAALVNHPGSGSKQVVELIRDLCWDPRLTAALPKVLAELTSNSKGLRLITASEDEPLNNLLEQLKWQRSNEELLLGRSLWRRQTSSQLIPGTRPLESMLGRLQPQQPPLPTPSLGRH